MSAHPGRYDGTETEGDTPMEFDHDAYERHVQMIAGMQVYYQCLWSIAHAASDASVIEPTDIETYLYEMACR